MNAKGFLDLFTLGYRLNAVMLAIVLLIVALPGVVNAQPAWPTKPITVVVPYPAGGIVDIVTRIVTNKIAPVLTQPIIVENRPGADGNIGTEVVARSSADGHTWLVASFPFTVQVTLRPHGLRYDPIADFRPVVFIGTSPNVFVVPATLPVNTMKEFIAYAKTRPVKLTYASAGNGTSNHLSTELFTRVAGIEMLHVVYKGQPQALLDVIAGRVDFMNVTMALATSQIMAGKLKALALVNTERHDLLPDVPTIVEAGYPNAVAGPWFGVLMPAQTPGEIVQRVNEEVVKALQSPDVIEKLQRSGVTVARSNRNRPEDFSTFIKAEIERWRKVIKDANIKVD